MGNHIRGEASEIRVGATQGPRITQGHLVAMVSGTLISGLMRVTPANAWTWDSSLATTQANFKRTFVGVSRDFKLSGDFRDISVATEGVYTFPCAALGSGFSIGEQFGPAADGSALAANSVAPCASGLGIGLLVRPALAGDTSVQLQIAGDLSTAYHGLRSE